MQKSKLRKEVQSSLARMTSTIYRDQSFAVAKKVLQEPSIKEANIIGTTISNIPELDTIHLIESFWRLGKKVAVPKCDPKTRQMKFFIIDSFAQLETVYMHLREPITNQCEFVDASEIDVMLVPGVVFDKRGYRIGYGGGYYDRFLLEYKGELLSLIFDEQIRDDLPIEVHDCPVNVLLTPTQRIDCLELRGEH